MTAQTVFNKIVRHLRKQGKKAKASPTLCAYLAEDGSKCAVGCLISDKHYNPSIEGASLSALSHDDLPAYLSEHWDFLMELQDIHDCFLPDNWNDMWIRLAKKHNLKVPAKCN